MEKEINLINLNRVEGKKVDVSMHVGKYAKISDVNVVKTQYGNAVKVETLPVETIIKDDGSKIDITASRMFSLSKEGEIIIGSKLDKFLIKHKVEQPAELIGSEVQMLKNEHDFLTF